LDKEKNSILGIFWTVVIAISEKFCMHVEQYESADVSENLSEFENLKCFISQMITLILNPFSPMNRSRRDLRN
jgi:hypothetical protein